jgi:hypothetical protein
MAINYLELIDGMKFPATRAEIVEYALENDASHEALDAFRAMPQQHFPTLAHVSRAVGLSRPPSRRCRRPEPAGGLNPAPDFILVIGIDRAEFFA